MPFTPFRRGLALALKAIVGQHFSLLVFGMPQVVMDIEPLIGMLRRADVLHGWTHSYGWATLIGVLVTCLAPPLGRLILVRWNSELESCDSAGSAHILILAGCRRSLGGGIGTYSHVALGSSMHRDIVPFWPWSNSNELLGFVSIEALYMGCVSTGVFGVVVWCTQALQMKRLRRTG